MLKLGRIGLMLKLGRTGLMCKLGRIGLMLKLGQCTCHAGQGCNSLLGFNLGVSLRQAEEARFQGAHQILQNNTLMMLRDLLVHDIHAGASAGMACAMCSAASASFTTHALLDL